MTDIILTKTLPASKLYTGSGVTSINLKAFGRISISSKNDLLKIQIPKTKSSQNASPTDLANNMVIDLKKITQVIQFSGYLDDDNSDTAWNKFWKLVAMQTRGGALTLLQIGTAQPAYFPSGSPIVFPTNTPQAFVTSVKGDIVPDDTGDITASFSSKPARIMVDLEIYLGYER